ncbi:ABC transporter permease [Aestuariivirga sp.]|uniref:ABC transporter permease n=1 Tax=Aestuariivirga sp. TaxID=2650926 RepID=UPI0039E57DD4
MRQPIWTNSSFRAAILVALAVAYALHVNPGLLSTGSMIGWSTSQIGLWTAVLGQTLVLMGRGIDLSVGAGVSFINVVAIALFGLGLPLVAVVPAALFAGLLVGAANGLLIGYMKLNPLLSTFAMSFVLLGLTLLIQPAPGGMAPIGAVMIMNGASLRIPNAVLMFAVVLMLWGGLIATRFWVELRATGSDPQRAFNSGISIAGRRFLSYTLAGGFTALSGLFVTFAVGAGDPLIAQPYTLLTIAGAVIGGVAISGGSGSGYGAILGAIFIGLTSEVALGVGVSPFYQQFIIGVVLLLGLVVVVLSGRWLKAKGHARMVARHRNECKEAAV